jgi:hypothetical protein
MATEDINLVGMGEVLLSLGFKSKLRLTRDPSTLVFLNMRPYPIGDGKILFGQRIGRLLARLGTSTSDPRHPLAYLHGVHEAFLKSTRHIPILNDLVRVSNDPVAGILRKYKRGYERSFNMRSYIKYHHFTDGMGEPEHVDIIPFLCHIYKITPAQIARARAFILNIDKFPYLADEPTLNIICSVDCGIPNY